MRNRQEGAEWAHLWWSRGCEPTVTLPSCRFALHRREYLCNMTEVLSKTRACVLSFKQLLNRKPAWSSSVQTKHVTLTLCIIGRCCVRCWLCSRCWKPWGSMVIKVYGRCVSIVAASLSQGAVQLDWTTICSFSRKSIGCKCTSQVLLHTYCAKRQWRFCAQQNMQFICSTCGMLELRPEGTMKTAYNIAPVEKLPRQINSHANFDAILLN